MGYNNSLFKNYEGTMHIDFNTNFKDFLENSTVYKNILEYIHNSKSYTSLPEGSGKTDFMMCVQATVECLVIHHDLANSNHYARSDIEDTLSSANSQEVRQAFKKNMVASQHVKALTYLYFTEENQELTHLRKEIYRLIPQKPVVIDFNTNYKGFLESSPTYSKVIDGVQADEDFSTYNEEMKKEYTALAYTAFETIVINWGVHRTPSFQNTYLVNMVGEQNSKHVQKFIKKNGKRLMRDGEFIKCLVQLVLSRPADGKKRIADMLHEELESYNNSLTSA